MSWCWFASCERVCLSKTSISALERKLAIIFAEPLSSVPKQTKTRYNSAVRICKLTTFFIFPVSSEMDKEPTTAKIPVSSCKKNDAGSSGGGKQKKKKGKKKGKNGSSAATPDTKVK